MSPSRSLWWEQAAILVFALIVACVIAALIR
jgi:hypothetical protein